MADKVVTPYNDENKSKKDQVAEMFDNISQRYDFLNHLLSMGIDKGWRRKGIKLLKKKNPETVLDIATGTGDFAIAALKLNPRLVTGVDISKGMLEKGKDKIRKRNLESKIDLLYGDSENLPFGDNSFDAITVGFGVRNFENLEKGLKEMHRVLNFDGVAVILEFSKPKSFPIKPIYNIYSKYILPFIGNKISKDKAAYTYLPESVNAFPEGKNFTDIFEKVGFKNTEIYPLTGGIASIYIGRK